MISLRIACGLLFLGAAGVCPAADQPDVKEILSWLPPDTESVIGVNGPLAWKDLATPSGERSGLEVPSGDELKLGMAALPLGLFALGNGGLQAFLNDGQISLAIEGSRHFRPPKNLGRTLFEGCAIVVVKGGPPLDIDAFLHQAGGSIKRVEKIEDRSVAVFEETQEKDLWTTFLAFPRKDVVMVATNADYLRTVLARMRAAPGPRALPESLPEWKYTDTSAAVWGVRHYARTNSDVDPTSPFHGKDAANVPDKDAHGVAFQFDPASRVVTLTYLSSGTVSRKVLESYLGLAAPSGVSMPKVDARFRQVVLGVMECDFLLAAPRAIAVPAIMGLMSMFGHAVYL